MAAKNLFKTDGYDTTSTHLGCSFQLKNSTQIDSTYFDTLISTRLESTQFDSSY